MIWTGLKSHLVNLMYRREACLLLERHIVDLCDYSTPSSSIRSKCINIAVACLPLLGLLPSCWLWREKLHKKKSHCHLPFPFFLVTACIGR